MGEGRLDRFHDPDDLEAELRRRARRRAGADAVQKSSISSASGSAASSCGETMSPVRYESWNSPNVSGSGASTPESKIRTGSVLVSS